MDINRFRRLSAEGLAEVTSSNGDSYLSFKRFDPENGRELEPELQLISKAVLEQRKSELTDELETISELLKL